MAYYYAIQMWRQLYHLQCEGCGAVVTTKTPNIPPDCPNGCKWVGGAAADAHVEVKQ